MARKKRQFIDRNRSVTFKLVGRSQDDPLFVDETAPQYVLVEKRSKDTIQIEADDEGPTKRLTTDARRAEQAKFGVYFDDDYDYLQHLIDPKVVPTLASQAGIEIQNNPLDKSRDNDQIIEEEDEDDQENEIVDDSDFPTLALPSTSKQTNLESAPKTSKQVASQPKLMLPSSVFDTGVREKESLTKKAALPVGPQLDWDPDIVEAMDDDYDFEDPNNQIDDDFVSQAMMEKVAKKSGKTPLNDEDDDDDSFLYDFSYKTVDPSKVSNENDDENDMGDEYYDDEEDGDNLSVCAAVSDDDDDEARDEFTSIDEVKRKLLQKKNFKQFMGMDDEDEDEDDRMTNRTSASTHFTEYSMSSSVVPRNDQLKLLDEKFEQMFIREYADELGIGALDGDEDIEEGGTIDPNQSELMSKLVEEFQEAKRANFGLQYQRNESAVDYVRRNLMKFQSADRNKGSNAKQDDTDDTDSSSDTEYEEIEIEDQGRKGDKERQDCESILSTYSNTNYHPKVLRDTDRYGNILLGRRAGHIRFNPRTGMPIGVEQQDQTQPGIATAANLAQLDQRTTGTQMSRVSELSYRPKNETPEKRRERKTELKKFRAQRRVEKKANREAFAQEKARIHKTDMNTAVQKKIAVI